MVFTLNWDDSSTMVLIFSSSLKTLNESPHLLIYGTSLWFQPAHGDTKLYNASSMCQYVKTIDEFSRNLSVQWPNTTLIFALQDIATQLRFSKNGFYNTVARHLLKRKYPNVVVWDTASALSAYWNEHSPEIVTHDGYHLTFSVYSVQVQFLMNFLFNDNCLRY